MLRQDAFTFGDAISELSLMESICDRSADLPMDAEQIVDTRQLVHQALQKTRQICIVANLEDRICPEIMRFQASLETEPLKQVALRCSHLRERILDELKNEFYFHV